MKKLVKYGVDSKLVNWSLWSIEFAAINNYEYEKPQTCFMIIIIIQIANVAYRGGPPAPPPHPSSLFERPVFAPCSENNATRGALSCFVENWATWRQDWNTNVVLQGPVPGPGPTSLSNYALICDLYVLISRYVTRSVSRVI